MHASDDDDSDDTIQQCRIADKHPACHAYCLTLMLTQALRHHHVKNMMSAQVHDVVV